MTTTPSAPPEIRRDWPRYLRVATFFAGAFLAFIWWELIAGRLPLIGAKVRQGSLARWRQIAQRYRRLAIRYGGVLIKLGQFLSIRVDVLPPEITAQVLGGPVVRSAVVTGTVRNPPWASIITGSGGLPPRAQSSARNSV